ncbi:MAG: antibiotic biosynthesis monooxygenase [Leptolyngbyaceae bacterium]|nr:antibiotic biosynthesis monooxygenase [Leptolyngbyaceae bacterium]
MHQSYSSSEPVTIIISEVVAPDRLDEYEAWTQGINQAAQRWEGFMAVEVLRPRDNAYAEYVVIIRFDSYEHLRAWVTSEEYFHWIEQSRGLIEHRSVHHMAHGLEVWFAVPRNESTRSYEQPPYYKKVILGVLAVYPLILLSNALLGTVLEPLPPKLGLLISVLFVSSLLTYPVMPMLTHLLDFWLYPSSPDTKPT